MEYHHGEDSLMNTAFKSSSSYSPSYYSSSSSSSISTMSISSSSTLVNSVGGNLINMQNNNVNYSTQSSTVSSSPISNMAYSYDDESEKDLYQQYLRNQALETPILIALIIAYAILIFIGAFGNGLVCLVVARNPRMRTPQNLFIVNLAISDLLLCFFTIPFSLFEIATKFWPYGVAMCKLVLMLEATSIFVSTMSIIAIALDRYHVILHSLNPSMNEHKNNRIPILFKIILIWIIGIILSLPLCLVRTVNSHYIGIGPIDTIYFCIEKWPIENGRAYYSVFSMLIQYVIPIIIVTVVYTRLCLKLQSRTLRRTSTTQLPKLKTRLQRRARKTNLLLISIALIFFISWLPLNVLNIIADFYQLSSFKITFAICHMFGMSSACSNPFLYGWLNQTFRNEFREIINSFNLFLYRFCCCCFCGCCECVWKNATNTPNMSTISNNIGSKQRKSELPNTGILQSGVQDSEHSTSIWHDHNHSQHQRVIHFRPKNDQCTIKDNSSNSNDNTKHHHHNHHPDNNNNCKIIIETCEKKGKNFYKNTGNGKVNFSLSNNINESSVQMMMDLPTETTQVYLNNCNSMVMMDSDDLNNDEEKEKKEQEEEEKDEEEEEEEKSSPKYDQIDQDFDREQQHKNDEEFIINKDHNQHNENINFYLKSPNISNNNHNNNNNHHPHPHHQQCKFKRLSLADSRKRKRKDSAKQPQQQSKSPPNDQVDQYQYLEQNKNHQNPGFNDDNNNVKTHNNENVIIVGDTDDYYGNHDHNDGDYGYCNNKNNNNYRFYDKNCATNTINNDRRKIF